MRDHHQCRFVLGVELKDEFEYVIRRRPIQISGRLIGEYAGGMRHECTCDRDALAFTAGKLARLVRQAMREPGLSEDDGGALFGNRGCLAANGEWNRDVFKRGELGQQMMELIDKSQRLITQPSLLQWRKFVDALAEHVDFATCWRVQSTQDMQQRAFT